MWSTVLSLWQELTARLDAAGASVPPLVLRIIMGWEFWESGREKYSGSNWFADIQSSFPFPFNVIPADLSWLLATWFELIGGLALWLGVATRFFAFTLLFLTFVATAAVHWPDMWSMWSDLVKGYSISDRGHGNFKLPLLFSVMLLPLIFTGPGRVSLDHLIGSLAGIAPQQNRRPDAISWGLAALVLGIPFLMLIPMVGFVLTALGIIGLVSGLAAQRQ